MTKRATKKPVRRRPKVAAESNGHLEAHAGIIPIMVCGGENDGKKFDMDCTLVSAAANGLFQKHKLATGDDGNFVTTVDFLRDLDAAMQDLGYPTTPTIALGLWNRATEYLNEIQKKTS